MYKNTKIYQNESGLVSLVVTFIIMIVLSLIVTGFAQIARREGRLSLDRQLSTQATYAAESGINDAKRAIFDPSASTPTQNPYSAKNGSADKTDCQPNPTSTFLGPNTNRLSDNVSYSCLLIDQSPPDQTFDNISTDHSTLVNVKTINSGGSATNVDDLTLSWQAKDASTQSANTFSPPALPTEGAWNSGSIKTGILRVDVAKLDNLSRTSLSSNQFTVFLYPQPAGSNTVSYVTGNPAAQGAIVNATCNGSGDYYCTMRVTGLNYSNFVLRVRSIYSANKLIVKPTDPNKQMVGGQIDIDSTGKAGDVLKRIKVRSKSPDSGLNDMFPDYGMEVQAGICKKISTEPTSTLDLCGNVPAPAPTPGPGPSPTGNTPTNNSLYGQAAYAGACDPNVVIPNAPPCNATNSTVSTVAFRWDQWFWNQSVDRPGVNPTGDCTWNFGDRTSTSIVRNRACSYGESLSHQYPILQNPLRCYKYTVTLTRTFTNAPPATYTSTRSVPSGYQGTEDCIDQGGYRTP